MSVLQPPPKRQKIYKIAPELGVESAPNVVVQFVTDEDGQSLAPAVNLPADLERDTLESLVNKLSKSVSPSSVVY
jgi:ribosome assembly protein 4